MPPPRTILAVSENAVILVTLGVYMVVLLGIGVLAARRTRDDTDFFLGGRKLGPLVSGTQRDRVRAYIRRRFEALSVATQCVRAKQMFLGVAPTPRWRSRRDNTASQVIGK